MIENLNDSNFMVFAAKHYDNPHCFDDEEFLDDIKRFKYLKKLLKKYEESGMLRERLILNHIIIITNLFGIEAATRMLFLKIPEYHPQLKTFLVFLNMMPNTIKNIGKDNRTIINSDIPLDQNVIKVLRAI